MSEDEKTNILLGEYEATAENLRKGVNVCRGTICSCGIARAQA